MPTIRASEDVTITLPREDITTSGDEELFVNPFLPRRSNTKPFFECEHEREGWDKSTWILEQQSSKFVKDLLKTSVTQPNVAGRYIWVNHVLHLKADLLVPWQETELSSQRALGRLSLGNITT